MWHVKLDSIHGNFSGKFETREEAESWVAKHKRKGRDAQTLQADMPFAGAVDIEKVKGPMGREVYRFTIPAEYTVEYKELGSELDTEVQWQKLRVRRLELLQESDYTMLPDVPMETKVRGYWKTYRQYLRDLPDNYDDDSIHRHRVMNFVEYRHFKKLFN